jgi:hypothetical protein
MVWRERWRITSTSSTRPTGISRALKPDPGIFEIGAEQADAMQPLQPTNRERVRPGKLGEADPEASQHAALAHQLV